MTEAILYSRQYIVYISQAIPHVPPTVGTMSGAVASPPMQQAPLSESLVIPGSISHAWRLTDVANTIIFYWPIIVGVLKGALGNIAFLLSVAAPLSESLVIPAGISHTWRPTDTANTIIFYCNIKSPAEPVCECKPRQEDGQDTRKSGWEGILRTRQQTTRQKLLFWRVLVWSVRHTVNTLGFISLKCGASSPQPLMVPAQDDSAPTMKFLAYPIQTWKSQLCPYLAAASKSCMPNEQTTA